MLSSQQTSSNPPPTISPPSPSASCLSSPLQTLTPSSNPPLPSSLLPPLVPIPPPKTPAFRSCLCSLAPPLPLLLPLHPTPPHSLTTAAHAPPLPPPLQNPPFSSFLRLVLTADSADPALALLLLLSRLHHHRLLPRMSLSSTVSRLISTTTMIRLKPLQYFTLSSVLQRLLRNHRVLLRYTLFWCLPLEIILTLSHCIALELSSTLLD